MKSNSQYLFQSERLGFRPWKKSDIEMLVQLNQSEAVMRYFPYKIDRTNCLDFISRMQKMYKQKGYCYFVLEEKSSQKAIGFTGLCDQTYPAYFTPCVDIGWRILESHWGLGFATEGAKRCIQYAKDKLDLDSIHSIAPILNTPSISVMRKIGLNYRGEFHHPYLKEYPRLELCVHYSIEF